MVGQMNPKDLARIELEARRLRSQAVADMFRAFIRTIARAPIVAGRTA